MPEQLGHYRILKKIGEGGMGEVFCAEDVKLGRNVALKILPAKFAEDAKRLRRFLREARLASTLSHPNVTHIYEVGEEKGLHYIAMEYVEGDTLQEKIRNSPLDHATLVSIAIQIAEALETAHAAGIVHRDVKPANIMLNAKNHVKILDFGLAKQDWTGHPEIDQLSTEAYTQAGTLLGTVQYMSPEQALGKQVDHRSDIFSFGTVLYEMATGKRAFHGPNATATIAQILATEPPNANQINPRLDDTINRIIQKCMRKDPKARYQNVSDLIDDLKRGRIDEQIEAQGVRAGLRPAPTGISDETDREYTLSRSLARAFFVGLQLMYLVFYFCALKWNDAMELSMADLLGARAASYLAIAYVLTAILGIAIRLHMLFLVLWDHVSTGVQFRKVFPLIFALDAFWAFAPFGLLRRVSGILLMATVPPLVFSPFSQRTLIRTAYDLYSNKRTL
jgi:predicted Ser/Thr protein kinase